MLCRQSWYDLSDAERRRDVFRAASKRHLDTYIKALSGTVTLLQDHPDLLYLNAGVAPTVMQLTLAQRGEMFALPLEGEARGVFFETLLSQLRIASGIGVEAEPDGRPEFLFVLKSIGQKVRQVASCRRTACVALQQNKEVSQKE